MPSPDQVEQFLSALERQGGSAGNVKLPEALGWDEVTYDAVKGEAIAQGKVAAGRIYRQVNKQIFRKRSDVGILPEASDEVGSSSDKRMVLPSV